MCPVLDPVMLTTVNGFFHGNVFYIVRRAKLPWLLLARHWVFLGIRHGSSHHHRCMEISNCWSWWHTGSCNTSLFGVFEGGEYISGVIFLILGQCQGQIRVQMSNFSVHDSPTRLYSWIITRGIQNWTHLGFIRKLSSANWWCPDRWSTSRLPTLIKLWLRLCISKRLSMPLVHGTTVHPRISWPPTVSDCMTSAMERPSALDQPHTSPRYDVHSREFPRLHINIDESSWRGGSHKHSV